MRIMLDTNVLISMMLFPSKRFGDLLDCITRENTLVLSSFVIEELEAVTEKKFPSKKYAVDSFLASLSYELVYTPHKMKAGLFDIRDMNDYPILYTAIIENVDVFVTGDKDFQAINVEKPEILTTSEFIERFCIDNSSDG
ncbi:MAG: putative toxin-antitoxin system toxin component, PIN family [Firmicutes bacterium]|nr:putative toxin-antitoxin system toxin component, PIN family [Bacillota bacterium]